MHQQLFVQARELATRDPEKPRQVNLRRAVSSAYYALFHALTDQACRQMLGAGHAEAPYRHAAARGFGHGAMRQACAAFAGGTLKAGVAKGLPATFAVPDELKVLARTFVEVQDQRHAADYDRTERFRRSDVLTLVDQAEAALAAFAGLPTSGEKKFFLVCLLAWGTLAGR
ncbi:MAG: hypothetical protein U0797_11390 [Gemmataceae bacterium]